MAGKRTRSGYDGKIAGLYDLEETIGQGHFAVVKLARHVFTGEKVAVKVIDKQKLDDLSRSHLFQEVRCMKLVQHPNVVRLYEVIDTQTKLYLILELGDGDMYDYIMRHDSGLNEALAKKYFRQIVEAITYCHRLHVVHRDLKPENVVFFDKLGQVKLTDFGFSNVFAPGKKLETSCGSLAYSAPEILLGDSYDPPAVDVWSLGVILFMLVAGRAPFQEANDSETLTMIMDCKYQIPPHVSDLCGRLITKMLVREPSQRINLTDIEGDPWLTSEPDFESHKGISLPLLTREHISDDDHSYVVQKMVEGKICSREEIFQSLEKDAYDHVAATYYLLIERRLRKLHQQGAAASNNNQANNSNRPTGTSNSMSSGTKPHLEPLMLSPRKKQEAKKTKTAPMPKSFHRHPPSLVITPPVVSGAGVVISPGGPEFVKSLTDSMTLDRHTALRKKQQMQELRKENSSGESGVTYSPQSADGSPRESALSLFCDTKKPPQRVKSAPLSTQGGAKPAVPKKFQRPSFSKIAILSSFFERKAAEESGATKLLQPHQRLLPRRREKKPQTSGGLESTESTLVQSLLSPPGTHPSPAGGSPKVTHLSPDVAFGMTRKCSLIHEESHEEEDELDDFDMDSTELKPSRSLELLDERVSDLSPSTSKELGLSPKEAGHESSVNPRRPLKSVCSSPQLLNQIHEENESEDEDDFVPLKLSAPRGRYSHSGLASPEILRKYEQRRRRAGAGQRGTSCSSSDASDTDDTDGRSRKDKLKHKFVHRRDSSDHSSDTDGPSGGNSHGGGNRLGGSSSGTRTTTSRGSRRDGGGGGNNGGGGSGGSGGAGEKGKSHSRQQCQQNFCHSDSKSSSDDPLIDVCDFHLLSEECIGLDLAPTSKDYEDMNGSPTSPLLSLSSLVNDNDHHSVASHHSQNHNISNHQHRRNHLLRQKQVICSHDEHYGADLSESDVLIGISPYSDSAEDMHYVNDPSNYNNNNNINNNNNNSISTTTRVSDSTVSSSNKTTAGNTSTATTISGISEYLNSVMTTSAEERIQFQYTKYCDHLLDDRAKLMTMTPVVECGLTSLQCQQCTNLNNNCLQSSLCKPGPGSVMVQLESKCCSVV